MFYCIFSIKLVIFYIGSTIVDGSLIKTRQRVEEIGNLN